MLQGVVAPQVQRPDVGIEQFFLAFVLLGKKRLDLFLIDFEQRRKRADVDDVLEQLALARL